MTLAELKKAFAAGKLAKPAYIDAMNERHRLLHEYASFIEDTDVASVEIAGGEVVMTLRGTGLKFVVRQDDKRTAPLEILNFGALEKAEADMTLRLVREGGTVFDVGANIGWYSLTLNRRFKRLKVHAFEPIPDTFARLKRHAAMNGDRRVTLHNFGFSDQRGKATFWFRPDFSVNASGADLGTGGRKVTCRIETLDGFARKTRVDFIKCDVEGAELFVFKGGLRTLARDTPVIFTEMLRKWAAPFGYHPNEIIDLLGALGYRPFTVNGNPVEVDTIVTIDYALKR